MAKLILSMESMLLKEIPLTKERMTIGRKPHNDIQIDNLAISGEHAVVVTILNDSFLEDLHSTNGTFINGHSVDKHFLQNGDVIELGKYRLKYVNEVPAQAPGQPHAAPPPVDFEKTMVLRPDLASKTAEQIQNKGMGDTQVGLKAAPAATPAAPAPAAPTLPPAAIQIMTGANTGKELEITKTLTTLGKPGVQVAVIARRPHGYFITHVEGANFPIVSGVTLEANKPHPLQDHDIIELAGVKMEFFFKA
jgi:hypothetical protein